MIVNNLLTRSARTVLELLTTDLKTELFLAKTHADVSQSSRLWGI
jgi:hypothetical protein